MSGLWGEYLRGVNISVGNEQIFIGTGWAGRAGSRLHDSIVMCLIALEMVELFKNQNAGIGHLFLTFGH